MKDPILVIFMRTDLNMSRGKMAVQAGHAVSMSIIHPFSGEVQPAVEAWIDNQQVKIVLAVNSLLKLEILADKAEANNLPYHKVYDAGKTEVEPGTTTCLAIGIAPRNRLQKITSGWKALK